ncbi:Bug family tripartite tricarboxylate transporter substrate binding protein [Cohaesibacter celericrescens]|uniref:Tripartite tricarboxylate transporter substrate-binding protein n=1 Tax=Cohaesibacter celericrescens TaxID=2067669 RepID=A0A2N5XQD9_9HYPH|nr:tripartite tricarboxylate transporter substrate binding protein [Cohaesibacter celericrescens]PLW76667.1 tripartite tricarboxylate transporter substrate-binding protein [Cohaesibacter celericrescens]
MKSHVKKIFCSSVAAVALMSAVGVAQAAWPERAVTIIVPWSAGGGTDATARMVASGLQERLGQPFNVVNRTGGGGLVGHAAIANAKADGYTLGVITIESTMYESQGLPGVTPDDYDYIGRYNADAIAINVSAKAEFDTAEKLIEAVKAHPGKITASGANRGGLSHLAWAGLLNTMGISPEASNWVASAGSSPAMQQLAAGAIDVVSTSPAEARSLVEAGEVKTLALISGERNELFPDLPTTDELFDIKWSPLPFRGLAAPDGMPQEAIDALSAALKDITENEEFRGFMKSRGFSVAYQDAASFEKTVMASRDGLAETMKAVGLAK